MKSAWDASARDTLRTRLARLTPATAPRWGRMNAPQMVSHLIESTRMATGELPVATKKTPLRHTPLKQLIIYWMPWPKGTPTAPELLARAPSATWSADVTQLGELLDGFASRGQSGRWPDHPAFGTMSARDWGVLLYRHFDHHLRQFGA